MMILSALYQYYDLGLLALRLALAAIFIVHGLPKLKMSQQIASGMGKTSGFVWGLGLAELLAGSSMLLGLLTQLGALILIVIMVGALHHKINKWNVPFTAMDKMGWEFDLLILGAAVALLTIGAGSISIDAAWLMY